MKLLTICTLSPGQQLLLFLILFPLVLVLVTIPSVVKTSDELSRTVSKNKTVLSLKSKSSRNKNQRGWIEAYREVLVHWRDSKKIEETWREKRREASSSDSFSSPRSYSPLLDFNDSFSRGAHSSETALFQIYC